MTSPPLPDPDPWLTGFQLGDWPVDFSGNRLLRGDEVRTRRCGRSARRWVMTLTRRDILSVIPDVAGAFGAQAADV